MNDMNETNSVSSLLAGASDKEELLSVKFMIMLMKSAMYDIQLLSKPPTPEHARGHEIIGNLVSIAKEATAKLEGLPYSAIIADNAKMLASSYVTKWLDGAEKSTLKTEVTADTKPTSVGQPLGQIVDEPKLHAKPSITPLPATQDGLPYHPLVADNAEMLGSSYIKKWLDEDKTRPDDGEIAAHLPLVADVSPASFSELPKSTENVQETEYVKALSNNFTLEPAGVISISRGAASLLDFTPDYLLDRRLVDRPPSTKPKFSHVASEYLATRVSKKSDKDRGIHIANMRLNMFIQLIGDHPIDTYTSTDIQAFIERMKFWPALDSDRPDHLTPDEIIESNRNFLYQPISHATLCDGYVAAVRAALIYGATRYNLGKSVAGARYTYPETSRAKIPTEPLSSKQITQTFEHGVNSGYLDLAMVPLLALLTGRRLGLLIHLKGSDVREKYEKVWVSQTQGIVMNNGSWQRVPIKNSGSMTFYVLHNFLREIGFIDWAMAKGDSFIFPELMRLEDPSKSASSYMGRLMAKAGAKNAKGEVFHSFRGGYIAEAGDLNVDKRDRKLQVGHSLGDDEHDLYGFRSLTEKKAEMLSQLPLSPKIDFSMFRGLDFDKLAAKKRTKGRRK